MRRVLAQWMRRQADRLDPQPRFALIHQALSTASSMTEAGGSYTITFPKGKP